MRFLPSRLSGLIVIEPRVFRDERGFFQETYRADALADAGIEGRFVQDNHSRSTQGVLRGIHFQIGAGQAKLVRCVRGAILDVAVDLRRGSPTYGEWESVRLDDETARQVYLPVGFGHGFLVLSPVADVVYKCSSYYDGALERGVAYDDPEIGIDWSHPAPIVSERDATAPRLRDVAADLPFEYEARTALA